ncbi:MAG: hypothetical protein QF662_05620 [Phycisphaerae bacterium]|jgi:hypothetical protein|nr:hypothetical protein [Phycisphaerae bacterium]
MMSLQETDRIDMIASGPEGEIILVACDTLPILDHDERLRLLMLKLEAYGAYARSDAFAREFPDKTLEDVMFIVTCVDPPTPRMFAVKHFPVTEGHEVPLGFKHIPSGLLTRECSNCGRIDWTCSELRECVFFYEETGEEDTYVLSCQFCRACCLFVPSSPPDDGQPECGKMETHKTFSRMSTYTFAYPPTGEERRHTLMALKCKQCEKVVVLGATQPAQKDDAGAT